MTLSDLEIPLKEFKRFGIKTIEKLEKNGIKTIKDLLYYFPYKYEDLTTITKIKDVKIDQFAVIVGEIKNVKIFRSPRKKFVIVSGVVSDETGSLKAIWFNQYYLIKTFSGNPKIALWGKLVKSRYGAHLSNPQFRKLETHTTSGVVYERFEARILPVYSEISGINSSFFEKTIKDIFQEYEIEKIKDPIPQEILAKIPNFQFQIPKLSDALCQIHNPKNFDSIKASRRRLAFEELFYIQLKLLKNRQIALTEKSPDIIINNKLIDNFLENFSFKITSDQKTVLDEILNDLKKPYPMNRLLQGEVGAGKTLIAEIAALILMDNGYSALMMAPTEILARQHFSRILEDFSKYDFGIGLLVSGSGYYGFHGFRAQKTPVEIIRIISQEKINFLIGTHALLEIPRLNSGQTPFESIGLVVIDEQQRFGTEQRKKLVELSSHPSINSEQEKCSPHILTMTATPIPRTLALTFYGDLDLSIITEKPKERKKVETYLIRPEKREQLWGFAKKEIEKGHQIFIICPRVEIARTNADNNSQIEPAFSPRQSVLNEIKAVKEEYERIKNIFPELKIEMMYGKMKAKEKDDALKKLQNGETQILIASSVVEVGIDLPLATVIIIESSERFGLSQLHQLRGRVGRSIHQSYCFLVMENYSPLAYSRLKAVVNSDNALELAEKDLEVRGAGELLGERQSGIPDLAMQALKDSNLVQAAKESAEKLIKENPELKDLPLLRSEIEKYKIILG